MNEKDLYRIKYDNRQKIIIQELREEIANVIKENEELKEHIRDLEEINYEHQKLVGEILTHKEAECEKQRKRFNSKKS